MRVKKSSSLQRYEKRRRENKKGKTKRIAKTKLFKKSWRETRESKGNGNRREN